MPSDGGVLDRRRWKTRLELANAMFEYLEIWHSPDAAQRPGPAVTAWVPPELGLF